MTALVQLMVLTFFNIMPFDEILDHLCFAIHSASARLTHYWHQKITEDDSIPAAYQCTPAKASTKQGEPSQVQIERLAVEEEDDE